MILQIYVYGNPWRCDDKLLWIRRGKLSTLSNEIFDNGMIHLVGNQPVTCASPLALKGVKISDLSKCCQVIKTEVMLLSVLCEFSDVATPTAALFGFTAANIKTAMNYEACV